MFSIFQYDTAINTIHLMKNSSMTISYVRLHTTSAMILTPTVTTQLTQQQVTAGGAEVTT